MILLNSQVSARARSVDAYNCLVNRLEDWVEYTALDQTRLRDVPHPGNDHVGLRFSLAHARLGIRHASSFHRLRSTEVYYILKDVPAGMLRKVPLALIETFLEDPRLLL